MSPTRSRETKCLSTDNHQVVAIAVDGKQPKRAFFYQLKNEEDKIFPLQNRETC